MNTLRYETSINAPKQKVWDTMLGSDTYKDWIGAAFPGSYYEGEWKTGQTIKFLSAEGGGILAKIVEAKPSESVSAEHIAIINQDGSEDRDSDMAKGWIGTSEKYTLTESDGVTALTVEMKAGPDAGPDWEEMFNDSWPKLLESLKELSEG